MAEIVAVVCKKGGVGKTTAAVNLAHALAEKGRRVLAGDLDDQCHLTRWYNLEAPVKVLSTHLIERGDLSSLVQPTPWGVDVLPGDPYMSAFDTVIALNRIKASEKLLLRGLQTLPLDDYDYVIFDCPPSLGMPTVNALTAADWFIIPVMPGEINLLGIKDIIEVVQEVRADLNPDLNLAGIVALNIEKRTVASRETKRILRENFDALLFESFIHKNKRVGEAFSSREPILSYAPENSIAAEFRQLANEVEARLRREEVGEEVRANA